MKNLNKIYSSLIYEWNSKSLNKQISKNSKYIQDEQSPYILCERTYGDTISKNFQDYFVKIFKDLWEELLLDPTNNYIEIPFKIIIEKLSKEDFKNYKDFDKFLDILKDNNGILQLSIINNGCYYECPIDIVKQEIKLYSEHPKISQINIESFNQINLNKVKNFYEQYVNKVTKNSYTLDLALKNIKTNLNKMFSWGRINIDFKYFQDSKYIDNLNIAVCHEFLHLTDFLINLNYQNWNYCRHYSNIAHNSFDRNIANLQQDEQNFERINYFLDSGEFNTLSSTYVEYLRNCFITNTKNISKNSIKNFLSAFYQICNFKFKKYLFFNDQVKKYLLILNQLRNIKDIKDFFQVTYQDSKYKLNTLSKGNKWFLLNKKLIYELKNQI